MILSAILPFWEKQFDQNCLCQENGQNEWAVVSCPWGASGWAQGYMFGIIGGLSVGR